MTVKLINKYDAEKTCDECGNKSIIQRAAYNEAIKRKKHLCKSCLNKIQSVKQKGKSQNKVYKPQRFFCGDFEPKKSKGKYIYGKVYYLP